MSLSEDHSHAASMTPGDGIGRRRRIARDLLSEAETIGRLLDNGTGTLGTDEILFLKRLRSSLLARAEELGQMTDEPRTAPRPMALPTSAEPRTEPRAAAQQPAPGEDGSRRAWHLAQIVTVSYLMFLFAFMGYLFAKSHLLSVDVTGEITDMLKIFLVPLVVLALGYFFGSSRR